MWPQLFSLLPGLLDKLLPDPKAADDAKLKLLELAQKGELAALTAETDLAKGQMAINQAEATNQNIFVSGWRPAVGWVCVLTIAFKYVGGPLLYVLTQVVGHPVTLPVIDSGELWPVLMGMLGLGGLRTYEKVKKAA